MEELCGDQVPLVDGYIVICVNGSQQDVLSKAAAILCSNFIGRYLTFVESPTREDVWLRGVTNPVQESDNSSLSVEEEFHTTSSRAV